MVCHETFQIGYFVAQVPNITLVPTTPTKWVNPTNVFSEKDKEGNMRSMYEPVHGSAPDIAGKGLANPIATILSFAMALKYSLNLDNQAKEIENAVQNVLNDGLRTKDIMSKGNKEVSTKVMGDAVIAYLQK